MLTMMKGHVLCQFWGGDQIFIGPLCLNCYLSDGCFTEIIGLDKFIGSNVLILWKCPIRGQIEGTRNTDRIID